MHAAPHRDMASESNKFSIRSSVLLIASGLMSNGMLPPSKYNVH